MIIPGERRTSTETAPRVVAAGANVLVAGEAILEPERGFAKYPVNWHPGVLIIATKPQDHWAINAVLDHVLRRFHTAADFYEARIIASTTGWRRITREGEERGGWEVAVREEGIEYSVVEAVEVGSS